MQVTHDAALLPSRSSAVPSTRSAHCPKASVGSSPSGRCSCPTSQVMGTCRTFNASSTYPRICRSVSRASSVASNSNNMPVTLGVNPAPHAGTRLLSSASTTVKVHSPRASRSCTKSASCPRAAAATTAASLKAATPGRHLGTVASSLGTVANATVLSLPIDLSDPTVPRSTAPLASW